MEIGGYLGKVLRVDLSKGQMSVAPGKAWSVGIGGERATFEIRLRSLMGSKPIR